MPAKIGLIDNPTSTNLKTVQIVRHDVDEDDRVDAQRGADELSVIRQSAKALISLEFDRLAQSDLGDIRAHLHNRRKPHKVFIAHPADAIQQINFSGITNPSSTHKIQTLNSDLTNAGTPAGGEIATGDYTTLSTFASKFSTSQNTNKFTYYFITFDLGTYLATKAKTDIARLTLLMQDPEYFVDSATDTRLGYVVDVLNDTLGEWHEIKRQSITADATAAANANQQFAGLRPVANFTNFDDYIDASDLVVFRIRNLQELNPTGGDDLASKMDYFELLINGYGCIYSSSDNFTFRDSFTGAGKTGVIELTEI